MLLKVRELLTADQWSKLQQLARARRAEKGTGGEPAPGAQRGNQPPRRWR